MNTLTGEVLTLPKMSGSISTPKSLSGNVGAKTINIGGKGDDGATFMPSVSAEGIISWTNDKELPNPEPVNIKGVKGDNGKDGADGGYYTPVVTKPEERKIQFSFNPSKSDMPTVAPVQVDMPSESADLSGYATEQWVKDQKYLTAVPEGYAKTSDIPTEPSDIGAQPEGDYALRSEIPSVPVKSVNGKTGAVTLGAADVKARPDSWMPSASDVGALPASITIPTKTSQLTNDSGYLTQHQDVSGKLDANKLPEAINTALAQAKASGEFDGSDGKDGKDGVNGVTPHVGSNGNWFIGGTDTGIPATGPAYTLTDTDKANIVSSVVASLPVYHGEVVEA